MAKSKKIKFIVSGVEEVDQILRDLDKKLATKVVRKVVRQGAAMVRKAARDNAPVDSGKLRKGIHVAVNKQNRRYGRYQIDVLMPKREKLDIPADSDSYYPAVVEYGSAKRGIPASAYIRRAYESQKGPVENHMKKGVAPVLREVQAKLKK